MRTMPQGVSVVYFNEPHKTIHATLPLDKEIAKKLAKRIYGDAMTELSKSASDTCTIP